MALYLFALKEGEGKKRNGGFAERKETDSLSVGLRVKRVKSWPAGRADLTDGLVNRAS